MIIKNALVYTEDHKFEKKDVRIEDERIAEIAENGQITAPCRVHGNAKCAAEFFLKRH